MSPRSAYRTLAVALGLWAGLLIPGCRTTPPLGEDFAELDREARAERVREIVEDVLETGGDREVLAIDRRWVVYRQKGLVRVLLYEDVEQIEVSPFEGRGARIYITPRTVSALLAGAEKPAFASTGMQSHYLEIEETDSTDADRLRAALAWLREQPTEREPPDGSLLQAYQLRASDLIDDRELSRRILDILDVPEGPPEGRRPWRLARAKAPESGGR